ncbi:GyrI-like domain-containing protein [Flavobacterium sp. SUN046]|uniref:GyrI-like domain-containing protein n=1 Tax=Flavobacterium sp. SUN046 TaxID=3002440 RepID=UPI002DBD32D7|nr:GyrI-like domain-containing protein [Flavobacterium sp. SUN046]MEC4049101.1 GyrI-like domain-containing protein [Flavobacterium sp. SUN046]
MQACIKTIEPILLVGYNLSMSFENNRTFELWSSFMPRRKEITNTISSDLYCVQEYEPNVTFNNTTPFIKWATAPVTHFNSVPNNMHTITIPSGLYAVFTYKGLPSNFAKTFNHIFFEWLPNSIYQLDNRPHFEILGSKYKNNDPTSEEDIYIPIKLKD